MPSVRALGVDDAEALIALRKEALAAEPLAFAASPEDDLALSPEFVRKSMAETGESAVLGYYNGGELRGMVGVYRRRHLKSRHNAQVWGMYVSPACRGQGAGAALLRAAIEQSRQWPGVIQIHLSVSEPAEAARRLYERAGFREWGREPRALFWEGRFVDEAHLALKLDQPEAPVREP